MGILGLGMEINNGMYFKILYWCIYIWGVFDCCKDYNELVVCLL